ncbi:hypothetical protein AJ88_10285 [Mesorhizobium amorphae CCBAU 01583]|nr:hypothetical protein AJ88_10285 [Mesorhizobium amorphae CCBAU 01583]
MRIGQRLLQARQQAGEGWRQMELGRLQRFEGRDMLAAGAGDEDDFRSVEKPAGAFSAMSMIASAPSASATKRWCLPGCGDRVP